jgi:hypothetical protein
MKRFYFKAALALAVILTSLTVGMAVAAQETLKKTDWREDYAYTLGVQTYIFSFPWVFLPKIQYQWVVVPPKNPALTPNMPITPGWNYIVRMYQPKKEILNGTWSFPKAQSME